MSKALPIVEIAIVARLNSQVLRCVAADTQRYCQTRFLCENYDVVIPKLRSGSPVPGLEGQRFFAEMVEKIQAQQERVAKALAAGNALFASFQSRAFRGEL